MPPTDLWIVANGMKSSEDPSFIDTRLQAIDGVAKVAGQLEPWNVVQGIGASIVRKAERRRSTGPIAIGLAS